MNVETILVSAVVAIVTSAVTAYITTRFKIREEKEKWQRDFTIKYAEFQSSNPSLAQNLATQFAIGVLIIEPCITGERERIFVPPNCRLIAGSQTGCDIKIKDITISKKHSAFFSDKLNVWVEELGSINGTFLNGARVIGRIKLETGNIIQLGNTKITFHKIVK